MKKTLLLIALLLLSAATLSAQSSIQGKKSRLKQMESEINRSQELMVKAQRDIESQMNAVAMLTSQIATRKQYIDSISAIVRALNREIAEADKELKKGESDLAKAKQGYAQVLRASTGRFDFEERLMFIFSTSSFNEMYHRYRYMNRLGELLRQRGLQIKEIMEKTAAQRAGLDSLRSEQKLMLAAHSAEQKKLVEQQSRQKETLAYLQKNKKNMQRQIEQRKREAAALDREISKMIEQERQAEERRRKQEAAARQKAQQGKKGKTPAQQSGSDTQTPTKNSQEIARMSGSFENNQGRLPVPVAGSYTVLSGTAKGESYDRNDLLLAGRSGLQARAIFDGEVSLIMKKISGTGSHLIVRHGKYLAVYSNLTDIKVKKGAKVKAGTPLGSVVTDKSGQAIMVFNLKNGTIKLNPAKWIKL